MNITYSEFKGRLAVSFFDRRCTKVHDSMKSSTELQLVRMRIVKKTYPCCGFTKSEIIDYIIRFLVVFSEKDRSWVAIIGCFMLIYIFFIYYTSGKVSEVTTVMGHILIIGGITLIGLLFGINKIIESSKNQTNHKN